MKKILTTLTIFLLAGCGSHIDRGAANGASKLAATSTEQLALIPYPESVTRLPGTLVLHNVVHVEAADGTATSTLALKNLLKTLDITRDTSASTQIQLYLVDEPALGSEGYRLDIDQQIILSANTDTGLFYAVQTLSQLLPSQVQAHYELPNTSIIDSPTFSWRGNMLDVARSFLSVEYIKAHIDRMARFKLNRLHLHLSDDQGWRIEITDYPKLTQIGGASAVDGGRSGFYTQAEIRDLVKYAQDRHVTLVPEIDLPGHTQAAIASYNELACDDVTNLAPYSGLEVGFSKLCLTDPDTTYTFVTDVLTDIVKLFPSQYIHIGGDEIKDPLYPEFIARATRIVADLGRTAIAWEEGSVADNDPDVLLQLWNDKYDIQPALDRGHQLILSPCSYSYFDHGNYQGQPNTYDWCRKEGVPLERAYQLNPQAYTQILGVESAMWSELIHTDHTADNRLWPRVTATAELGWSRAENRDYQEFLTRLNALRPMLDAMGIQYYREPALNW
ncbi:beta-N-acetylhexosaminidase [Gilvimarinus polysaccharolyticus]|uniref:beta-N-acetylhexosaminidase n=1 Tax=Gilvimarinus polysaccharolyticus TaxID=863921 RepID=UPI000673A126|nr:family 20 glycosylhydrolase [Gilvimarinus polysaccharolyticus]